MSDMSRFADIVSSEVYECIGGYYNVSVDYTEGSLASINVSVSAKDTDMPDLELETVFVNDNAIGFNTTLKFPDLKYDGDGYPDDMHYIIGKWYRLANGLTDLNKLNLDPEYYGLGTDEED